MSIYYAIDAKQYNKSYTNKIFYHRIISSDLTRKYTEISIQLEFLYFGIQKYQVT